MGLMSKGNFWEFILSFFPMGQVDQIQVVRKNGQHCHLRSHPATLHYLSGRGDQSWGSHMLDKPLRYAQSHPSP